MKIKLIKKRNIIPVKKIKIIQASGNKSAPYLLHKFITKYCNMSGFGISIGSWLGIGVVGEV